MTELKGIKLEDLNVTKETYINLICLLNPDLELPDDERIIFEEEIEKFESGQVIAFYHLLVYGDMLYNFCLSFFSSSLSGNSFYLSGYNVDTCDFSKQYLLDCLYKSGVLTPVEEQESSELTEEDTQEFELYESVEMPLCVFQLMQDKVNDYIDDNDIMEKYGDKEIPCGVVVKIEHNMSKPSYKCEIYDDSGEEAEKRISKIEPLSPLERTVFKAIEDCSSLETEYVKKSLCAKEEEQERYFLGLASIETLKANFLQDLISKAGLDGTYQAWLKERREREAVREAK